MQSSSSFPEGVPRHSTSLHGLLASVHTHPVTSASLKYIRDSYQNDPLRICIEISLFLFVVRFLLIRRLRPKQRAVKLTGKEVDDLVSEWAPEPLVEPLTKLEKSDLQKRPVVIGSPGLKVKLANGKTVLNLAVYNTFNLISHPAIQETAISTLRTYGVGACGPPGFYGTKDVDIQLESDIAQFLGVEAAIIYAQAFSTITSVIPAFSKREDVCVVDRGCNWAICKGLVLSKSHVRWYSHNDMEDLERVLCEVENEFSGKRLTRRFIITEAIFEGTGKMAQLPKIIELKHKYKYRLILDETYSFPVVGANLRGLSAYTGVDPTEVDILVGSLSHSLCNVGGFCAGSKEIVEHQRILGCAYVFSAALPAMYSTAASEALRVLSKEAPTLESSLKANIAAFRTQIEKIPELLIISSDFASPTLIINFHPTVVETRQWNRDEEDWHIQEILDESVNNGVLVTKVRALDTNAGEKDGSWLPRPGLKVCISTGFREKDVDRAGKVVRNAVQRVLKRKA